MSQADEETAKYKLNKNHYNYSHYGQMRKTKENKQQVMPLYENCTLNNNNDSQKPDHILLERSPVKSLTFNYDCYIVSNTINGGSHINGFEACNSNSLTPDYEYENINFGGKETLDKKILLQKYFRSALVGPRTNIYENLCRGCNYGVFNARGPLCTFCECIVNGVSALRSDTPETSLTTSNNIYENICEYCGVIYSGTNCSECKCPRLGQECAVVNLGSEELLLEKSAKQKKKVKINKSKSFSKTNKPRIFTNFWDTLRKPKNASSNITPPKKPLEIIHHVEGYEEVFHTKDTFDLKKICELKRSATSCSDQHIYGRLKQNDLSCSQDEFNSTQSLGQSSNSLSVLTSKKPRISKAKFLRTTPSTSSINSDIKEELNTATIYLNNSVCQWMTLLRHEIHAYNSCHERNEDTLCYPKSIPSKSVLNACKAPTVTNQAKNLQNLTPKQIVNGCGELTEILKTLKAQTKQKSMTLLDSREIQETEEEKEEEEEQQQSTDYYQLMVEEFKANILSRQMLKTKTKQQHTNNIVELTMAGVNNNDSNNNIAHTTDIPLRQAPSTATANTMTTNNQHNNKHKRQGMYLRLEDQQQLQPHNEQELIMNLHNNQVNNSGKKQQNSGSNNQICKCKDQQTLLPREREEKLINNRETLHSEHKAVNTPETLLSQTKEQETLKRCWPAPETEGNLCRIEKRRGIHERNVLEAFEALLEQERKNNLNLIPAKDGKRISVQATQTPSRKIIAENSLALQTFGDNCPTIMLPCPTHIPNIKQLLKHQQLAAGLNTLIICYDKYLKAYLFNIHTTTTTRNTNTQAIVCKIPHKQLWRKFQQFYNYCEKNSNEHEVKPKTTTRETTCVSSKLKLELNVAHSGKHTQVREQNISDSLISTSNELRAKKNFKSVEPKKNIEKPATEIQKVKTPPQVPKRDPKTKLSPTTEIKRFPIHYKMTKPVNKVKTESKTSAEQPEKELAEEEEESIYQPIWKFETKGKVTECYRTEDDYYDLRALKQKIQQESPNSEIPKILISDEILPAEEEDHNNWEPDEEFVFTTQIKTERSPSLSSERISTIRSTHSSNSSIGTSSSLSGSTITEFASSTATLASTVSSSLKHYLLRNIGIFYSLTEPKLRAIIYDYDRIHSFAYFNKPLQQPIYAAVGHNAGSDFGKSLSPFQATKQRHNSNSSTSPSTSSKSSPVSALKKPTTNKYTIIKSLAASESDKLNEGKAKVSCLIPNSVQAWKYQLLDVNCMEDEEDMIVAESEILRAQQVKEDIDQTTTTTTATKPQLFAQRFKSVSTENFLDIPIEGDKKTITERLANMYTRFSPIQRGILNINSKNSPKSEKKAYKLNRASQATSLCLEDGFKPRYPIFGAPLDQLELQQNVPRFVVDAVDYIERKDRIIQDGIYRACGNKFSIDELKQKLTKSYIYDSKLINADDIHTVTSLLKQFFRDLPLPVVPKDIYSRITANLSDRQGIDTLRIAIEEIKEPNKSTLRFLIKHLTNVAACSCSNRMNASNVAIVWGPSLFAQNDTYDMIGRMNTLTKVLIENYNRIFDTNERLL